MAEVDATLLTTIDRLKLSPRGKSLREMFFQQRPGIASERVVLAAQSWKETRGEPLVLRRAKLLTRILEGIPVVIHPGQLLVGSETKYFRGAYPHCDYDGSYLRGIMSEGRVTLGGPVTEGVVSEEDWQALADAVEFWMKDGQTCADLIRQRTKAVVGPWYDDLIEAGGSQFYGAYPPLTGVPRHDKLLTEGLRAFVTEAEGQVRKFMDSRDDDLDKLYFCQAAIIALEAVIDYAKRYGRVARRMAAEEQDPARRVELEEIAETCQRVPGEPARTFQEALQSVIFVHLAVKLETGCTPPTGWGLVDQCLYPYFKRDLQEGRLTLEKAADLVHELLSFAARLEWVSELTWRDYMQRGCLTSIGLGGPTRDGKDASNELSYLILHVMGLVGYAEPHIVMRWHKDTPEWLTSKALETNLKVRGGVPQFQNSEHIVEYLMRFGVPLEDALDWKSGGCSQAYPADTLYYGMPSYYNVPLCVDLALHNGIASATGKRLGPETGNPRNFESFEEFYDAFKKQWEYTTRRKMWIDRLTDRWQGELHPLPLASALLPGCLERGRGLMNGGLANYAIWYKKDRGIVAAADSLTAINKLVFDDRKFSMNELIQAVDSDFKGHHAEEIRRACLAAPKYGNDNDVADRMLRDVAKYTGDLILAEKNIFGFPYTVNRNGQGWHFMAGKRMGALPNGRRRGEPLPDGSLSPMQGMDKNGPTAVLNSAIRANFQESSLGGIMTLKLPAMLLQSEEVRAKVSRMTESFFKNGGTYIQYNVLDAEMLRDAKRTPEKYRDLVVRVGGYSAYFVDLSPELQDEIIRRTEQNVGSM